LIERRRKSIIYAMAPNTKDTTASSSSNRASRVSLSPTTSGEKHKQEENDEPTRCVSQRTEEAAIQEEEMNSDNWKESMKKILQRDLWSTDAVIVEEAMENLFIILYAVSDDSEIMERQKHFFLLGGHTVVVRVMKAHPNVNNLQHNGIMVLMNAASNNKKVKEAIVEVEGFEVILTAMKKHHSNDGILTDGTKALFNLVESHEAHANLFVAKHGGISFLLQGVQKFPNAVELIEYSCIVLNLISSHVKFRKSLVDAKAISALAEVFERHKNNSTIIRTSAREAITNLMEEESDE
jgi:hypothetical protein